MNEQVLRELLRSAADRGAAGRLDDAAAADAVLHARSTQRRQWAVMAAAAACVALVVVLVPVLVGDRPPSGEPAAPVLEWPARGSLAGDPAAVEAVRTLPWSIDELVSVEDRSVPFVGDVPGGRRALVIGPSSDPRGWDTVYGQWFTGPAGADPAGLVADSAVIGLGELESLSSVSHDGSGLVVLAAPGDTVEVSPRVVVGTDGSVRRDFTTAGTVDGVAMAEVDSTTGYGPAVIYRVRRDGVLVDRGRPFQPLGLLDIPDPPGFAPRLPSPNVPVADAVVAALGQVAGEVGTDDEDLRTELLWAGPISGPLSGADAVVLAVTLPNGAVVVSTAWARTDREGVVESAGVCGAQSHPAGTEVDSLAVAVRCVVEDGNGVAGDPVLLLVTPGTVTLAEVVSTNGATWTFEVLPGGLSMSPPPPGADRVRFGGPTGRTDQAIVSSERQIVDRDGHHAED